MIEVAGMESVEIRDAVNAEDDRFAIDDELLVPVFQLRPVVAAARDQPHPLAVTLDAEPVSVIFHLVNPLRPVGYLDAAGRKAKIKSFKHGPQMSAVLRVANRQR
jgi:hypothetical protein